MSNYIIPLIWLVRYFHTSFLHRSSDESQSNEEPSREKTYLVFKTCLCTLFHICRHCKRPTNTIFSTIGSMLQVKVTCCVCELKWTWTSQPYVRGIPQGNILMSASTLFSGSLVSKALRAFQIMNCSSISKRTLFSTQKKYLHPAISNVWKEQQTSLLTVLKVEQKPLKLKGDGRCDSPGFSKVWVIIVDGSSAQCSSKHRTSTGEMITWHSMNDYVCVKLKYMCRTMKYMAV